MSIELINASGSATRDRATYADKPDSQTGTDAPLTTTMRILFVSDADVRFDFAVDMISRMKSRLSKRQKDLIARVTTTHHPQKYVRS